MKGIKRTKSNGQWWPLVEGDVIWPEDTGAEMTRDDSMSCRRAMVGSM